MIDVPRASSIGTTLEFHYQDHDSDEVSETPPIQNQWYTVFDAEDVRLIIFYVRQWNTEAAAKDIEVRWTIDGNVYFDMKSVPNNVPWYVYRTASPSSGGTAGLEIQVTAYNAAIYVDKRGQSFKVEVRITSALGTNQTLLARATRETQTQT